MADQNDVDLDSIIDRLLEVRGSRPGKPVQLLETEIRYLCTKAREIFISQPILLELEAPIKVRFLEDFQLLSVSDVTCTIKTHVSITISLDLWRYSWPILRSLAFVRIWWIPSGSQLPLPGRLRRQRKAVVGDHLPSPGVQDQVSRELLHPPRQSRVRVDQPYLWLL